MNRRTVTVSTPVSTWMSFESALRGLGQVLIAATAGEGLELVERGRARIAQSGRHWLMD